MGFVMNDIETYKNSRGFYFKDLEMVLPGPILSDYNMLYDFTQAPSYIEKDINYNHYFDNNYSKRICDILRLN